jgi:hypothetical protein
MKIHTGRTILLMLVALLVIGSVGTSRAAHGAGRLIIWRVPGLGNDLVVAVNIDGRHAADLTYGAHLDTTLSPGRHVVSVEPYPRVYSFAGSSVVIDVRPGELYNFTAKGSVQQLILKRS